MANTKSYNDLTDAIKSLNDLCGTLEKEAAGLKDKVIQIDRVETKSDRKSFTDYSEELQTVIKSLYITISKLDEYSGYLSHEAQYWDLRNPETSSDPNPEKQEDPKEEQTK